MTKLRKLTVLASRLIIAGAILLALTWGWSWTHNRTLLAASLEKAEVKSFVTQLSAAQTRPLDLMVGDKKESEIGTKELLTWIETYQRDYSQKSDLRISSDKLNDFILALATKTNRLPVNARLGFQNGRATEFVKSVPGRTMDIEKTSLNITQALISGSLSAELVYEYKEPEITLTKINQLGITSLIGKGESDFAGSSQARIYNIRLGASKYNGHVIAPGEEFSFNNTLGEVSEASGFQSELVIKSGKLVREAGGGICQVSTTLFRAAIYSGLPILERRPHSFAVRYYNPQGFDSTIYPGVVDLKFKNDTPGHIMLQSYISGTKITFEIYGTDTGRIVTVNPPVQYDIQPDGSMRAYFVRKIAQNGETKETTFNSTYKAPPSAQERNPLE